MRINVLSVLLGVTAALLAAALFWPQTAATTHGQNDAVLQLDPEWKNVAYGGDSLPVEADLNDALGITESLWVWRSLPKAWDSWTAGGPALVKSLAALQPGDIVWIRSTTAGAWTQIGAAQRGAADGLNCWDLNGNGAFDPNEDIDADGIASALDCRGPSGPEGAEGAVGPEGPQGAQGEPGQVDALEGYEIVSVTEQAASGLLNSVTATCPPGKMAVGGGVVLAGAGLFTVFNLSFLDEGPTDDGTGWNVQVLAGDLGSITVHAVCLGQLSSPIILLP